MDFRPLLVSILAAVLIGWALPRRWQTWAILTTSLLAVFWLQPELPIRNLDFWLPVIAIILTILVWAITRSNTTMEGRDLKILAVASLVIFGIVLAIGSTRYLGQLCCLTPSRPPDILRILFFLGIGTALTIIPLFLPKSRRFLSALAICVIVGLFVVLKSPALLGSASTSLRQLTGQSANLASPTDIAWFGFSFLAFRLLHTLLDYRAGRLPNYRLDEFVIYALFFPALPAGPIDRSQRFISDLQEPKAGLGDYRLEGARRILLGLFKKFVLADTLALVALNHQNAAQVTSPLWMWLLLYAYALRIYFDFAGYTDLAIGSGKMMGISLPENFERPYLKSNLTAFWNSWHITLAQWFRAYYYNPLTRALRTRAPGLSPWLIILIGQFSTMLLIGLWHGISWNFALWGAWHGIGLFIHNRWTNWTRARPTQSRPVQQASSFGGWFLTFNFVSLGWVWFALPTFQSSLGVFQKLFGV